MASGATTGAGNGTQVIDRAALLVSTVVLAEAPLSFVDLHDGCGLPKSTTSRLLTALERTELLERTADGSYVAGPLFWRYATRHDPWAELVRLARPTLEQVGAETRETVNLSVARGDRVVQVAQVDSTYMLGTRDWTQVDVPAHVSSLGKVLLAYGVLSPRADLEPVTPRTVTDPEKLRRELAEVRSRGWASTVDELEIGLTGVGVPVRDRTGEVVAALGVSGPSPRLADRQAEIGELLVERAGQLTEQLPGLRRRRPAEGVA